MNVNGSQGNLLGCISEKNDDTLDSSDKLHGGIGDATSSTTNE